MRRTRARGYDNTHLQLGKRRNRSSTVEPLANDNGLSQAIEFFQQEIRFIGGPTVATYLDARPEINFSD
jgi:hypothetical protein